MTLSSIRKVYQGAADHHQMFRLFDRHAQRPHRFGADASALYAGEWFETTEREHDYMFEILPPLWIRGSMFAMREFLTESVTSVFFALRIDGVIRHFHGYCDLSDGRSVEDMRLAIIERETRPVRAMTRDERLEHIWSATSDAYRGYSDESSPHYFIYYEPRKVLATRGYFAVAKVAQVIPDPKSPSMYLALIEPGTYLDFVNAVPFNGPDGVIERGVLNEEGRISGRAQAAVRSIFAEDFNRILSAGLDEHEPELPRVDDQLSSHSGDGFEDGAQAPFIFEQERERVTQLSSRIVRSRLFRRLVLHAYDKRCAITGLKLINGGGRAEVDAAHIRPVEANGPDIISNGIALSGTAHWMFDRGLISLTDDLDILISRQANDPDGVRGVINRTGRAIVPSRPFERPHPRFLQWHRENCFKH